MWQPDGRTTRARIGVLTPHIDPVPETEFQAMAPEGVTIHVARVPLGMVAADGTIVPHVGPEIARAFASPPGVDEAVHRLAGLRPGAIVYAFTSSSYVMGAEADNSFRDRLSAAGGAPVTVQSLALLQALGALRAHRIALFHPPWFSDDLDALGADYFAAAGFDVLRHAPSPLRKDYGDLEPGQVAAHVTQNTPERTEAVVIGGGGFRAIGAIAALEARLGIPVPSGNQASFWHALRQAGVEDDLKRYGRLFGAA